MEKSSIHFENVKPTSQSHNLRQRTFDYVRKELTPLNKSYGNMTPHPEVIEELKKINLLTEKEAVKKTCTAATQQLEQVVTISPLQL